MDNKNCVVLFSWIADLYLQKSRSFIPWKNDQSYGRSPQYYHDRERMDESLFTRSFVRSDYAWELKNGQIVALFPGPAQLSIACSTNSDGKLGGAWVPENGQIAKEWADSLRMGR